MFQVHRYDPDASKQKEKKKRKRTEQQKEAREPALPEIAPLDFALKLSASLPQEALDDLDPVEESETIGDTKEPETSLETTGEPPLNKQPSIETLAKPWKLPSFLLRNLRADGISTFFPIQSLVLPEVLITERQAHLRVRDVCVTAPTGSGKTLSYLLPIVQSLSASHTQHCCRALIVLPSRDLATQVYKVFEKYVRGSSLKVGLAMGQTDFVQEQKDLTVNEESSDVQMLKNRLLYDPHNLELALRLCNDASRDTSLRIPAHGWSNIDILVCTPGRLVDHLDHTRGFTLQHLKYLVVDEADRLLSQSYHKWIDRVLAAAKAGSVQAWRNMPSSKVLPPLHEDRYSYRLEPITWRRGGVSGDDSEIFNSNDVSVVGTICQPVQLRKFLVSATLTRDPQKLAALRLVNPKHFDVHQVHSSSGGITKYSVPESLEEFMVECTAEQKPLVLLSLLFDRLKVEKNIIVVFTASLDSTHRLARLLQLLWSALGHDEHTVGEFSSSLKQTERASLMKRCIDPEDSLSVVVCSDGMSRGMDIESVGTVINYDVPSLAKTYVHRCGRTARASRKGTAISILKGGQVFQYKRMRRIIQNEDRVRTVPIKKSLVRDAVPVYGTCIQALKHVLSAENAGELGHTESLKSFVPSETKRKHGHE